MSIGLSSRARCAWRPSSLFRGLELMLAVTALAFALSSALVHAVVAQEFKGGGLTLDQPWSRATPTGAKVAGGYVVIRNAGPEPDRLVSVTSEISGRAEIHEMAVKDGVMTMRQLADGLVVPAKGETALKPGSYHLMFLDLKRPLKQGETFAGTLTFEKAGAVDVTFEVRSMAATGEGHGDSHDQKAKGH